MGYKPRISVEQIAKHVVFYLGSVRHLHRRRILTRQQAPGMNRLQKQVRFVSVKAEHTPRHVTTCRPSRDHKVPSRDNVILGQTPPWLADPPEGLARGPGEGGSSMTTTTLT